MLHIYIYIYIYIYDISNLRVNYTSILYNAGFVRLQTYIHCSNYSKHKGGASPENFIWSVFTISNKLEYERFVILGAVTVAICLVVAVTLLPYCTYCSLLGVKWDVWC